MNRKLLNRKRIALVIDVQGRDVVLRGTITLARDTKQGIVLKVVVDADDDSAIGAPVFLISEAKWKDRIASGLQYDCLYLLDLTEAAVAAG